MSAQPKQIGKTFAFIFWGLLLAFFYFFFSDELAEQQNPNQTPNSFVVGEQKILILQRNRFGHYVSSGFINDQKVVFMLDTGATNVAVPKEVADKIGLAYGQTMRVNTANGITTAYRTNIAHLKLGEIELENVNASIVPGMKGPQILLGMSVLKQVEFSQVGDQLTLKLARQY